jgi:hypothetical protein
MVFDDTRPHCKREPKEQVLHDQIIERYANKRRNQGYLVKTNKGNSKKNSIKIGREDHYPDIIVYDVGNIISKIYEVETESSINNDAIEQWKAYSKGPIPFILIIPKEMWTIAKELIKTNNIKVHNYIEFEP